MRTHWISRVWARAREREREREPGVEVGPAMAAFPPLLSESPPLRIEGLRQLWLYVGA